MQTFLVLLVVEFLVLVVKKMKIVLQVKPFVVFLLHVPSVMKKALDVVIVGHR